MWRSITLLAVVVSGCFAPQVPTGAHCAQPGAIERCPSGLECVAHDGVETCEAPGSFGDASAGSDAAPDASVDLDRDHDGVSDSLDNCPDDVNPNQANEDGDGVGDVCDVCPPFVDNTDGDGDGVGDACDPNPTTAGDTLVAFYGFGAALPAGWTTSGTFMASGGDGQLIAGDDATSILSVPSPVGARVEVRAAFVIDLITASGVNLGSVSLVERLVTATDKSIACQLSGLVNGTQEQLRIFDASTLAVVSSAPRAFATGVETELRLRRNGNGYLCRVMTPALEIGGSAAFSPASPRIGLRTHGAAARFHWVMLVTSP